MYNLVIDHPEGAVLWDTGSHPEAGDGYWPEWLYDAFEHADAADRRLEDELAAAGYGVDETDCVVQTHLHVDHAGGLYAFEGTGFPVFVHRRELEFAYFSAATGEGSAGCVQADFDRELNWRVIRGDRASPFEGVELLRLPGHTPGMLATLLHLDGGTLLFTSDLAEAAANYERERPPGRGILRNRDRWVESVHRLKDLERRHDAEAVYGHDPAQRERILDGWP